MSPMNMMGRLVVAVAVLACAAGVARAEHPTCNSITIEPVSLVYTTTLSAQFERAVRRRVGVAVLAGVGSTKNVAIGDRIHNYFVGDPGSEQEIRFRRIHLGVAASYYAHGFRGLHVSGEVVYLHHGWTEPSFPSIDAISASAYGGWKWMWHSGLTVALQGGLGIVGAHRADLMATGWRLDRGGTLGPVHLAANASIGYSF